MNNDRKMPHEEGSPAGPAWNAKTRPRGSFYLKARKVKALVIKEFYQIIRDPSTILISFILPAILLFLYGFGLNLTIKNLDVGLLVEDTSPEAISFAQSLAASPYFNIHIRQTRQELERDITAGTIRGMVIIPTYFSQFQADLNQIAPIQVIADGSIPNTAHFVQNYVQLAWQTWLTNQSNTGNERGKALVTFEPRFWYNEDLESRNFLLPGSFGIIMTLVGTLLTSLVIARDWERGVMEVMMSNPITISMLLVSKLIPYFILGMVSMNFGVISSVLLFEVPFVGSWWVLEVICGTFLLSALGLGLLISTLGKNQFMSAQVAIVVGFLPGFFLSGFIFELASLPFFIRLLTYPFPVRYFVSSLQTVFLVGNVPGLLIFNTLMISILTAIIFIFTARYTRKRLD